jgi:hypothetical protein
MQEFTEFWWVNTRNWAWACEMDWLSLTSKHHHWFCWNFEMRLVEPVQKMTTNSTEQSPYWKADGHSASWEFTAVYGTWRILPCSRTHHQFLSWARCIQFIPSCPVFKTHFNIILPSTSRSSQWPFPFKLCNQNLFSCLIPHSCCMSHPSHHP